MKLPFTIKLGAVKGVFARLNPKGLITAIKAKLPGKKAAKGDRDEDDFRPSTAEDDDMFGDLGDLDALDAEAKLKQQEADANIDYTSDAYSTDKEENLDNMSVGGAVSDAADQSFHDLDADDADTAPEHDGGIDMSVLEDMPDFGDDDGDEEDDEEQLKAKKKKLMMVAAGGVAVAVVIGASSWLMLGSGGGEADTSAKPEQALAAKHDAVISLDNVPFAELPDAPAKPARPQSAAPGASASAQPQADPTQGEPAQPAQPETAISEEDYTLGQLGLSVAQEPGVGVVVPSGTKASFAAVPPAPKGQPLSAAPLAALVEQTDVGVLPKIAEDGLTPYEGYARPAPNMDGAQPKVAIIVTGVGLSRASTENAIASMPQEVALALDMYARGLDFWVSRARDDGHEVLLTLPLESGDFPFEDPGPDALKSLSTPQENVAKLNYVLSRTSGYFGVMAESGGKFLTVESQVNGLMEQVKARGLMYVDSLVPGSLGSRTAYKLNVPWAAIDMNLDDAQGRAEFERMLEAFENLAAKRSVAIARVSATPLSMEQLNAWLSTLSQKGMQLVPVSALAKKQLIR